MTFCFAWPFKELISDTLSSIESMTNSMLSLFLNGSVQITKYLKDGKLNTEKFAKSNYQNDYYIHNEFFYLMNDNEDVVNDELISTICLDDCELDPNDIAGLCNDSDEEDEYDTYNPDGEEEDRIDIYIPEKRKIYSPTVISENDSCLELLLNSDDSRDDEMPSKKKSKLGLFELVKAKYSSDIIFKKEKNYPCFDVSEYVSNYLPDLKTDFDSNMDALEHTFDRIKSESKFTVIQNLIEQNCLKKNLSKGREIYVHWPNYCYHQESGYKMFRK